MRARILPIVLVVLALVTAACGDDKKSSSSGTSGGTPTEATLEAALFTQADVPSGLTLQPAEDEEEAEGTDAEGCLEQDVDDVVPPAATASADFSSADSLRTVTHELRSYEDDGAEKSMEEGRKLVAKCRTFQETEADGAFSGSIADLDFPTFGDDTAAFVIKATGSGFAVEGHFVVVRKGNVTTSVGNLVVNGAADRALTESLVQKALAKLG